MVENSLTNPRDVCLNNAAICDEQARAEPKRHEHWSREAARWRALASDSERGVSVNIIEEHEVVGGKLIPKLPRSDGSKS